MKIRFIVIFTVPKDESYRNMGGTYQPLHVPVDIFFSKYMEIDYQHKLLLFLFFPISYFLFFFILL